MIVENLSSQQQQYDALVRIYENAHNAFDRARTQAKATRKLADAADKKEIGKLEAQILKLEAKSAHRRKKYRHVEERIAEKRLKAFLGEHKAFTQAVLTVEQTPDLVPTAIAIVAKSDSKRNVKRKHKTAEVLEAAKPDAASAPAKTVEVAEKTVKKSATTTAPKTVKKVIKTVEVATETAHNTNVTDDLTRIEGIAQKSAALLNGIGIFTFAQLAASDVTALKAMLKAHKFYLLNPATWAEQAALAAKGNWDALDALQKVLIAGRRK
jgi:predicted flap endonuclease-1-like 5' DNA nuclease